ncbi:rhodanese-like domain-containing protein [Priestia aryabhattai]|uniref:rhodanese-like domain-containing protein n=1 Tax=Priestia aryabhattai TaxID=412384 RepID=UPI001D0AF27D|nr:rhodanese-like domain-containing protein [Priestia aryabhattai]
MIINALIIVFLLWFLYRRFAPVKGIQQIATTELKAKLKNKNNQFIDVRTPHEFRTKHIKGFRNMPLSEMPAQTGQLSKDREVVVICQSGMRSMKASKLLKKQGGKRNDASKLRIRCKRTSMSNANRKNKEENE